MLYPFGPGTQYAVYDQANHLLTLEDDPANAHLASYKNAARITTFVRPAPEQLHGAVTQTYRVSSRLLSSSPLGKILTGPVHFRVTQDTLSGYPKTWSS